MTLNQFLREISKTSGWKWGKPNENFFGGKCIRSYDKKNRMCCPITRLANKKAKRFKYDIGSVGEAGKYLGLKAGVIDKIVCAADVDRTSSLYKRLLKACKLK